MIILIIIGLISGIISGMGVGGGTLLIPMLVFLKSLNQQTAQNINLIYFIPTAIISLITHYKNDNIETKIIKKVVIFGVVGAFLGSLLATKIEPLILRKIFGVFLFIIGLMEVFKKGEPDKK